MKRTIKSLSLFSGLTAAPVLWLLVSPTSAHAKQLNVVTTTTDLAALTREVGGDKVNVASIAKGYQELNAVNVEDEPGAVQKLRQADLEIVDGRFFEIWLPMLTAESKNSAIREGGPGYLDASQFAEIIDAPHDLTDFQGNPHYLLDPDNGRRIAKGIANKLGEVDPADAAYFQERFQDFDNRLSAAEQKWDEEMRPYRGRKVVTYHRSFTYFAKHFGLDVVDYIDPLQQNHINDLIKAMKRENCNVVLVEPDLDLFIPLEFKPPRGAQMLVYLPSVDGEEHVTTYFELFDYDINLLVQAFNGIAVRAASADEKIPKTFSVKVLDLGGDLTIERPDAGLWIGGDPYPVYVQVLVRGRPYTLRCQAASHYDGWCAALKRDSDYNYTGWMEGETMVIRGKINKPEGQIFFRTDRDVTLKFKIVRPGCFYFERGSGC
jgi:zinc/manganese transport system substrate-binding protein